MADSLRTGLRALTAGVSVITMLGAAVVLVGWVFDLPTLKSLSPHWASMKVNTAIAFGLSGLSLWIQRHEGAAGSRRRVARFCGGFAALIGFLTMSEHAFRLDLGIDQALIPERHGTADTSAPGRMSPVTAVCFVAVGVALLFLDRRTPAGHRPAQSLALLPAVCGLLAVAGYLFGARSLYTLGDLTAMALPTATLFLALSQGILCARPDAGPLNVLVGEGSGSRMARRLLPLVITLPFLITSLAIMAERAGLVDPASGIALHAVGNICVFAGLLWMTAVWLNRADAQTKQAEHEVRAINAELEKRVRARTSALRAQAAQLEAANAELESFAYSVSHDLRSPLRAIDGFSQALGEDYADRLDATGRDYLGRIRAAAQRMGQLIDDLLNLSRVNRYVMEVKSVDLTALARDCAARLQEEASGRVIRFEIAESLSAQGDEKLLRIAFENLLGNAVKFTSRRHEALVEVGGSTRDGGSTFFVRDKWGRIRHGESHAPFWRLPAPALVAGVSRDRHRPRHRAARGPSTRRTGLGRGRTRKRSDLLHRPPPSNRDRLMSPEDKVILLVEDNPDDELLALRALKKGNILNTVVVARDGAEALDYLFGTGAHAGRDLSHPPQLVLLDLKLPVISGLEVLKRIREDPRTRWQPVVILTSSKEEQDLVAGYSLGANSYIRKPVDFEQFTEAARHIGLYWLVLNEGPPRAT